MTARVQCENAATKGDREPPGKRSDCEGRGKCRTSLWCRSPIDGGVEERPRFYVGVDPRCTPEHGDVPVGVDVDEDVSCQ